MRIPHEEIKRLRESHCIFDFLPCAVGEKNQEMLKMTCLACGEDTLLASKSEQVFYCTSCKTSGNIFGLLQLRFHCSFVGAVEILTWLEQET